MGYRASVPSGVHAAGITAGTGDGVPLASLPDRDLSRACDLDLFLTQEFLPWQRTQDGLLVAVSECANERLAAVHAHCGAGARIVPIGRASLLQAIEERFRTRLVRDAVYGLLRTAPGLSASRVVTRKQAAIFAAVCFLAAGGVIFWPLPMAAALAGALALVFVANIFFRLILVLAGEDGMRRLPSPSLPMLGEWPVYTILVPLYREANMLLPLVQALRRLDYPAHRLDIKLAIEADDYGTRRSAENCAQGPQFEIVLVPPSQPRTKPKACNYALRFARGEFVVIFDAEDRPEPDQLKKAVAAFRIFPPDVGCLQARLNFYNRAQNWLTRLFALDYALWFDYLLPGLDRLGVPLPLGGTSNHFRAALLRRIHGWDPFNVTEDADIGIRMARLGYRVATLDSTTFEEATSLKSAWLRQRSRWLKGYMQTWLVHMRDPRALLRNGGIRGFAAFQLFIAGTFLSALANPILWIVFLFSLFTPVHIFWGGWNIALTDLSLFSLAIGNAGFTYLAMIGPYRRGWLELIPYGILAPFYWALVSFAAYRALGQLLTRPFYWEKTPHGFGRGAAP